MRKKQKNIHLFSKKLSIKAVSVFIASIFLLNTIIADNAEGLNVWLGNQLVLKRQEMMLKLLENRLVFDDSLKEISDVELLSSGRYMVSPLSRNNNEVLLRSLINKDFHVLMDILEKEDMYSYRNIIDLIKNDSSIIDLYFKTYPEKERKYRFSKEALVKDIIAKVFEINFLLKNSLVVDWLKVNASQEEKELIYYDKVFPLIEANKHIFPDEFWKQGDRYRAINNNAEDLIKGLEGKERKITEPRVKEKAVITPDNVEASLDEAINKVNYTGDIRSLENTLSRLAMWAREDYDTVFEGVKNFSRRYPLLTDDNFHVSVFNLDFHDRAIIETIFRHIFISSAKREKIKVCILAAGSGIRTWPLSNGKTPKQLRSDFLGDMSPLQATVKRLTSDNFLDPNQIFITTNKKIENAVIEQVRSFGVPEKNIIVEPQVAGTAMAVGYMAKYFEEKDPESTMIIMVADSYISKNSIPQFRNNIIEAASIVQAGPYLSGIGVKPTPNSAETQYGYIKINDETVIKGVYRVNRFYEKPDINKAEEYSKRGDKFLWEAGIIAANVKTVIKAFQVLSPEYYKEMERLGKYFSGKGSVKDLNEPYDVIIKRKEKGLPIHINPVITEAITKGMVPGIGYAAVRSDISWTDIGDLRRFPRYLYSQEEDNNKNIILEKTVNGIVPYKKDLSGKIMDVDNCNIILSPDRDMLVKGVSNGLIIDSGDSITTLLSNAELSLFSKKNERKGFLDIDKWDELSKKGAVQARVVSGKGSVAYSRSGLSMMNGMDNSVLIRLDRSFEIYGEKHVKEGIGKVDTLVTQDLYDPSKCLHVTFDENDSASFWSSENKDFEFTFLFRYGGNSSLYLGLRKDGSFDSFSMEKGIKKDLTAGDIKHIFRFLGKSTLGLNRTFDEIKKRLKSFSKQPEGAHNNYEKTEMPFEAAFLYSDKKSEEPKAPKMGDKKKERYEGQINDFEKDSIGKAIKWMLYSGAQNLSDDMERKGAFHGYFDSDKGNYPFVYSEITGYAMSFLSYLYLKTGEKEFLNRAELAADWILTRAIHKKTGGVKTRLYYDSKDEENKEFSFKNEGIHMFDTGIVINGLISLYKITGNRDYIKGAERMGDFILSLDDPFDEFFPFAIEGKTERIMAEGEKWSRSGGAFQVKALNGLVDLYQLTNDSRYSELAVKACKAALRTQKEDGRFVTENHDGTSIHPHCYAAEGLLYIGRELDRPEFIESARKATKWLFDNQMENGGIPLLFTEDLEVLNKFEKSGKPVLYKKDGGFLMLERTDGLAQALRLGLYFYEAGEFRTPEFKRKLIKLKKRLEFFQVKKGDQTGGFEFGYEFSGERCDPEAGNIWVTMFAIQALAKFNRIFDQNEYFMSLKSYAKALGIGTKGKDVILEAKIKEVLKKHPELKICIALGTRPEIIKLWPILYFCQKYSIPYFVVNTNQNFTKELSEDIFKNLGLNANKTINLHNPMESWIFDRQTFLDRYTERIKGVLDKNKPTVIIVQGDTNSACAASMAAYELSVPVAHVEAGMRSFDLSMPEERNRIAISKLAQYHFAPTNYQIGNLDLETDRFLNPDSRFYVTGNTIVDALDMMAEKVISQGTPEKVFKKVSTKKNEIIPGKYFLVTLHRPSNVDDKNKLLRTLGYLQELSEKWGYSIVFPVHPRTESKLAGETQALFDKINFIKPVDYEEMYVLEKNAVLMLTDSGGVQEEAAVLGVPCVVLRDSTERVESIYEGMAILVDSDEEALKKAVKFFMEKEVTPKRIYGDGNSSKLIIKAILGIPDISTIRKKPPLMFKDYERSQLEKLRLIYRQFGFNSFNTIQLISNGIALKEPDISILEELDLITTVDKSRNMFRINGAFKGRNKRDTEKALSAIYNMEVKHKDKTRQLWQIDLSDNRDIINYGLKEDIKLELTMYNLKQLVSGDIQNEEMSIDMTRKIKISKVSGRNIALLPCKITDGEEERKAIVVDLDWLREEAFIGMQGADEKKFNLWKTKYPKSIYLRDKKDLLELSIWPITDYANPDITILEWVADKGIYREPPASLKYAKKVSLSDISLDFIPTQDKKISLNSFPKLSVLLKSTYKYIVNLSKEFLRQRRDMEGKVQIIEKSDTYEVVIWQGYAGGLSEGMCSSIEKASKGSGFNVRFEKNIGEMVNEANGAYKRNSVYILPYLENMNRIDYGAQVICINTKEFYEENSFDPGHLADLITLGITYHKNDNIVFRAIQQILKMSDNNSDTLTIEDIKSETYLTPNYYKVSPGIISDMNVRDKLSENVVEKLKLIFENIKKEKGHAGIQTSSDSSQEKEEEKLTEDKTERRLLGMQEDDILSMIRPGHIELKKHSEAVWKYAERFAEKLGIKNKSKQWNILRVICYAHDVGGYSGFRSEESKEDHLKLLAERAKINYLSKAKDFDAETDEVLENVAGRLKNILGEKDFSIYKEHIKVMDHQSNSMRVLNENNIVVPEVVKRMILNHQDVPGTMPLLEMSDWSDADLTIYLCFILADCIEHGNNYYKINYQKKKFEEVEDTIKYFSTQFDAALSVQKQEAEDDEKRQKISLLAKKLKQKNEVLFSFLRSGEMDEDIQKFSRNPIQKTRFARESLTVNHVNASWDELPFDFTNTNDEEGFSTREIFKKKMFEFVRDLEGWNSKEIPLKGSVLVFSEKVAFDHGLAILLPRLAEENIEIGIIAKNNKQEALIAELNERIKSETKIKCIKSINSVKEVFPKMCRCYYYMVKEDLDDATFMKGIIPIDITDTVDKIVKMLGATFRINADDIIKLHEAMNKFKAYA